MKKILSTVGKFNDAMISFYLYSIANKKWMGESPFPYQTPVNQIYLDLELETCNYQLMTFV